MEESGQSSKKALMSAESFVVKNDRLRSMSPFGHLPGWKIDGLIAKSNDDVRQEVCLNSRRLLNSF